MRTDRGHHTSWRHVGFRGALLAATFATLAVVIGPPASAANPSVITDPAGDTLHKAPSYMDIVGAQVSKGGSTFSFQMTLLDPIPATPGLQPPADKQISWGWPLDTDPTTFPAGSPLAGGQGAPAEFIVYVVWDGSAFRAFLLDRRPMLSGGEATSTPLPHTISGTQIQVNVEAGQIANPSSFLWGTVVVFWSGQFASNNGNHRVDQVDPFYTPSPS